MLNNIKSMVINRAIFIIMCLVNGSDNLQVFPKILPAFFKAIFSNRTNPFWGLMTYLESRKYINYGSS